MRYNSLIMKDKLLIGIAIISSATLLEGCGKTETTNELRIVYQCADVEDTVAIENSYTFQKGLPSGATITTLVASLNANAAKAHGTFAADGSGSFNITCDKGYTWLKDVDPAYGTEINKGSGRDSALATWDTKTNKQYR
ncbi:DUF3281 family protein [Francisella tularensis subsp. holarctica]|nr:DUF3281 family protein [Francisella tularensis subsp. holarctica]